MRGAGNSTANLPVVSKQNGGGGNGSINDTRDSIKEQETSRRSSHGGFAVKRPKLGEPDFDYSSLNMNLRWVIVYP